MIATVPNPPPTAPFVVTYFCSDTDAPWGNGWRTDTTTWNLATGHWTRDTQDASSGDKGAAAQVHAAKQATGTLSAARTKSANAAVDKLLHGGPYQYEFPVPEGTRCLLGVTGGGIVFYVDKSNRNEKDAATALLVDLQR